MFSRTARGLLGALATVLTPMAASAQQPTQPSPQVQEWLAEINQLQQELAPLHEQAMQDPALQQEQEEVSTAVREAMVAADPVNGERLDRLEQLETEAQAARASGDSAKVVALASEAQELVPELQAAQEEATQQPEIDARVKQFEDNLVTKMVEMEPSAQAKVDRLDELNELVSEALGRGGD